MIRASAGAAILSSIALLVAPIAHSSPLYSGQFVATWSNPVLSGITIDGATGAASVLNNTANAACDIAGCPQGVGVSLGSTTLAWGISPQSSTLNFDGHFFVNVPEGTVFDMGRITFFNGTSDLSTIIFGATLNLTYVPCGFCTPNTPVDNFHVAVPIVTTANTGTDAQNADWVGPFGTPATLTFNVLEGFNADAELYAEIVGDPMLQPEVLITTDPHAFIGNGQPLAVPEPTSLSLLLAALFGLRAAVLRSRRAPLFAGRCARSAP
jgi:hypothetical protein